MNIGAKVEVDDMLALIDRTWNFGDAFFAEISYLSSFGSIVPPPSVSNKSNA